MKTSIKILALSILTIGTSAMAGTTGSTHIHVADNAIAQAVIQAAETKYKVKCDMSTEDVKMTGPNFESTLNCPRVTVPGEMVGLDAKIMITFKGYVGFTVTPTDSTPYADKVTGVQIDYIEL